MTSSGTRFRSSRLQRLRARALWTFCVAGVGFVATVVGLVQYVWSGGVSIRPGRDPVVDSAAVETLIFIFFVSVGFAVLGLILRRRAKRT